MVRSHWDFQKRPNGGAGSTLEVVVVDVGGQWWNWIVVMAPR